MSVRPMPGEKLRQTTETEIIPPNAVSTRKWPPRENFWDFIEGQTPEFLSEHKCIITIYRGYERDASNKRIQCDQLYYPEDSAVRFSRRWLEREFGGGPYNIMVKLDDQLVFNIDHAIEGEPHPRPQSSVAAQQAPLPMGLSPEVTALVQVIREQQAQFVEEMRLSRGGNVITESTRQALDLNAAAFRNAAQTIAAVNNPPVQSTESRISEMVQLMTAMKTIMAPQNSLKDTLDMIAALKGAGLVGGGGSPSLISQGISVLPQVMQGIAAIMASSTEAQKSQFEMMSRARAAGGAPPGLPAAPAQPGRPEIVRNAPAAVEAQPANPQPAQPQQAEAQPQRDPSGMLIPGDYWEMIESRIVTEVLADQTVDNAANNVLVYLDVETKGDLTDRLLAAGPDEVLKLFASRRILQQVPQNPRLTEFIKRFLELAAESRQPPATPEAANSAQPQPSA